MKCEIYLIGFCQFAVSECHLAILQSHVEKSWYQPLLIIILTEPWMLINALQTGKDSVVGGSELDTVLTAIWITPASKMLISLQDNAPFDKFSPTRPFMASQSA